MIRPGVLKDSYGSGEHGKVGKSGCQVICGASATPQIMGLMMITLYNWTMPSVIFLCLLTQVYLGLYWAEVIIPVYPDHCLMHLERCHFQSSLTDPSTGPPHNYMQYLDPYSVCQSFFQMPWEAVPHIGNSFS